MLNILKKKSANKIFLIFFISILLLYSQVFATSFYGNGRYLNDDVLKKVEIGMSKIYLVEILGDPTFTFLQNNNCLCYYYLYAPKNKYSKITRRCALFFFKDEALISYKILLH